MFTVRKKPSISNIVGYMHACELISTCAMLRAHSENHNVEMTNFRYYTACNVEMLTFPLYCIVCTYAIFESIF